MAEIQVPTQKMSFREFLEGTEELWAEWVNGEVIPFAGELALAGASAQGARDFAGIETDLIQFKHGRETLQRRRYSAGDCPGE